MDAVVHEIASFLEKEEDAIKDLEQEKHENNSDILPLVYDFEAASKSRLWMRNVLLKHCQCDEESDDSMSEEEYKHILKMHKMKQRAKYKVGVDASNARFKYYSSDVITHDKKWVNHYKTFKVKKRKPKTAKEVVKPKNDDSITDLNELFIDLGDESTNQNAEEPNNGDAETIAVVTEKTAVKKRKVDVDVLRKRIWRFIARKEIPKAYRQKCQYKATNYLASRKFCKEVIRKGRCNAMASQKFCKDTVSRARRLTREMQMFWKRYSKVEKVHRKKAEKHAQEQRKLDENIREAKRQQRKLNFLISQTELFAHFLSKKLSTAKNENSNYEDKKEQILSALTDDFVESTIAIESLGGNGNVDANLAKSEAEAIKEEALKTVEEALMLHQNTQKDFEQPADPPTGKLDSVNESDSLAQPAMFRGQLKSYQLKGMSWLVNLYHQGISGILADEMGLGKTVQTIAFLAHLSESVGIWGPFLVIAPASTLNNWHQEFCNFLPDFKVLPYWGNPNDRKILRKFWSQASTDTTKESAPFHVLVTSYQLVISDVRCFQRVKWQMMVLDEAQALKSSTSARWKTLLDFKCRNRLLLTGTPIQNTMAELWALLHFIMPSLFDSHAEFNEWFSKDIESHIENKSSIDQQQLSRLHLILKPFMLRRIKKDVENELSEKIEVRVNCSMMFRQSQLYRALQKNLKIEDLLQNSASSAPVSGNTTLLNLVMQFRKMCNHPDLFEKRVVISPIQNFDIKYLIPKLLYHDGFIHMNNLTKSKLLYQDLNVHSSNNNLSNLKNIFEQSNFGFLNFYPLSYSEYWTIIINNLPGKLSVLYNEHMRRKLSTGKYLNGLKQKRNLYHNLLDLRCNLKESILNFGENCYVSNLCFTGTLKNVYQLDITCENTIFETVKLPNIYMHVYSPRVICNTTLYCNDRNAATFCEELKSGHGRFLSNTLLFLYGIQHHQSLNLKYNEHSNARIKWKEHSSQPNKNFLSTCGSFGLSAIDLDWCKVNIPSKDYLITDSGKMYALDILLKRLKNENHRVLIYSQMTKMIDLLEEYMLYRNHTYIRLDGSSRINDRRDMVADFQNRNDIFVFLLSTRAGGLGINLTAADTVIFYDSDWNPTVDQQAMDRTHRLGQTKQVTVYRLVCQGTVDERILQRAEEKNIIQKMVISGGHFKQENLKTKEVVSLLLDDQQLLQNWNANKGDASGKKQQYKGKKRGRKPNAEKDAEQTKRLRILQSPTISDSIEVVSTSSEPTPVPSPGSNASRDAFASEEDALIIVDDNESSTSSLQMSTKSRRARGRPRIRPIQSESAKRGRGSSNPGRSKGSATGSKRGRKPVHGRAAEMAGARAGAVAASAAAYAAYGYEYKDQQQ